MGDTDFALSARWIGEGDEARAYSSPESEPFVHGSVPSDVKASANAASEKKADKKKPKEEKKAEEKEVKNDSQDKLVEVKEYKDNPFEKINYRVELPKGAVLNNNAPEVLQSDYRTSDELRPPMIYVFDSMDFTEENSEIKFSSKDDGYVLSIKSTQTIKAVDRPSEYRQFRDSHSISPDRTHNFDLELIFREDNDGLYLVSGKVKQNSVFYMRIDPYYILGEKKKDDGQGIRWEKCAYEASYSFTEKTWDNWIQGGTFLINDYKMKANTKEHARYSPNVVSLEWSEGKEDPNSHSEVTITLYRKE